MSEVMSFSAGLAWTREVLRQWGRWTRGHLLVTLGLSALAFAIGWVWNTYLMAVGLDGSAVDPDTQTAATADGHTGNGLFWLLLFSLAGGLVTYAWSRGWKNFWADLAALPRRFAEAVTSSRTGALAMLLWGMSISLVISTLISSAVSLALGLVLLAVAATPVGVILNFALIRLWRGLSGIVAPTAGPRLAAMASPFMVMLGEALGLFLDWMIGGWLIGLLLGVASAVVSVLLVRVSARPSAAAVVILAGVVLAWQVVRVRWAYADDGGWSECVTSDGQPCSDLGLGGIFAWLSSPGAGHVVGRGAVGGVFATIGAAFGVGIGGGAAAGLAAAAAQTSSAGQPPGQRSGASDRPGPAGSADGDRPSGPGRVYESRSTYGLSGDEGGPPSGGADVPPAQRQAAETPPETTSASGGQGTLYQGAFEPGMPDSGLSGVPASPEPVHDGSPHPYLDIGDILPEPPDREDDENDENDEGPTRRLPPQR